eukprot:12084717-Heterocapsa_arctica.AAC.1
MTSTSDHPLDEDLVIGCEGQTLPRRRCTLIAHRCKRRGCRKSVVLGKPFDAEAKESHSGCRRCCGLAPLALALALATRDRTVSERTIGPPPVAPCRVLVEEALQ